MSDIVSNGQTQLANTRVLVTGATGQLGSYLRPALAAAGATVIGAGHQPRAGADVTVDVADQFSVEEAFRLTNPDIVIHAAAWTDVDGCERDPERAEAVNAAGSAHVAESARRTGAYLLAVGTDFVFAGDGGAPYSETSPRRPLSVYGRTKLAGEQAVLDAHPGFAVARTAWLYGGAGKHFPRTVLTVLRDRGSIEVVADECGSPTFAGDLAAAIVALATRRAGGIFHLVNEGRASRFELARAVAAAAEQDPETVRPTTTEAFLQRFPLPARRPADSVLANNRAAALGIRLRPWEHAIAEYGPILAAELGIVRHAPPEKLR
jgi:dTDP-4-dehydrorhamnose reductase